MFGYFGRSRDKTEEYNKLTFGLLVLAVFFFVFQDRREKIYDTGEQISAVVVLNKQGYSRGPNFRVLFEAGGETRRVNMRVSGDIMRRFPYESRIPVRWLPEYPRLAMIDLPETKPWPNYVIGGLILLGAFFSHMLANPRKMDRQGAVVGSWIIRFLDRLPWWIPGGRPRH